MPDEVDCRLPPEVRGRYASVVDSINDIAHRATTLRLTPQEARLMAKALNKRLRFAWRLPTDARAISPDENHWHGAAPAA